MVDPASVKLGEGETLAERYRIEAVLGEGGMGKVYLATDLLLSNMRVALKTLHSDLCCDPKHKQRFLREVQLNRMLNHPNVVKVFDIGAFGDGLYLTMEYVEGQTLKQRLLAGRPALTEAIRILKEICKGLEAVHGANVIHRDLKPGNVLLGTDSEVKIADFGVARPGISELTAHDEVIGCAPYIAPEVWMGRNVTASADIYALGIIAYEMIAGELPFDGDSPADLMRKHLESKPYPLNEIEPSLPDWVNVLVLGMLEKEPAARPESASEIFEALRQGPTSSIAPGRKRDPTTGSLDEDLLEHLREAEALASVAIDIPKNEEPKPRARKESLRERPLPEWDGNEPRHIIPPEDVRSESSLISGKLNRPKTSSNFVATIGSLSDHSASRTDQNKLSKIGVPNWAKLALTLALVTLFLAGVQIPAVSWSIKRLPLIFNVFPNGIAAVLTSVFSGLLVASLAATVISLFSVLCNAPCGFMKHCAKRWLYCWGLSTGPVFFLWVWFFVRVFLTNPGQIVFLPEVIKTITEAVITNLIEVTLLVPEGTFFKILSQNAQAGFTKSQASLLSSTPYFAAMGMVLFAIMRVLTAKLREVDIPSFFTFALIGSLVLSSFVSAVALPYVLPEFGFAAAAVSSFKIGAFELSLSNLQIAQAAVNYMVLIALARMLLPTQKNH